MPKSPAVPPPPPAPPTVDKALADVNQNDLMRRRRGRAADLLAPVNSTAAPGQGGVKQYLG